MADQPSPLKLHKNQRIYANRSLNMSSIQLIGFDMDHTMIVYNNDEFEELAFNETLKKFLEAGYPQGLAELKFDSDFVIRGLMVDMERGNLLKVDAHKYVKVAFHGKRKLSKPERHAIYNSESFDPTKLLSLDTFFALSEVQLFMEIVEYKLRHPESIPKSFREIYDDLRLFIDESHRDGSIKTKVISDPGRYIKLDKHLLKTLIRYREAGKKLFLLTNSGWAYTNAILTFALQTAWGLDKPWTDYFDYKIVGARKPGFFTQDLPFYEVMTDSGLLKTFDGKLSSDKVYFGGNCRVFQNLTGVRGDKILYLGDHIFGDIIRSKEYFNWRTLFVLGELDKELAVIDDSKAIDATIDARIAMKEKTDESTQRTKSKLTSLKALVKDPAINKSKKASLDQDIASLEQELAALLQQRRDNKLGLKQAVDQREANFHPIWGSLLKVGIENSRLAKQMEEYSCLYTSKVSNLRFYSPFKLYLARRQLFPHDS